MAYDVIGIRADGTVVEHRKQWSRAPNDARLVNWGQRWACAVVIRYWPSKKGWIPLDIREVRLVRPVHGDYFMVVGARRGPVLPTEEAATMFAIHKLQQV